MYAIYRSLALLFGCLGTACFYGGLWLASRNEVGAGLFAGFLFGIVAGLYAAADHLAHRKKFMWSEPITPSQIERLTDTSAPHNFCLYLRPLTSDAEVRTFDTYNPFRRITPGFGMPYIEIQEWLMHTASTGWRFLSEGGIRTNIRPVVISSSADWFEDIKLAGSRVDAIIILPGATEGIRAEFQHFVKEHPERLIVIAPPRRGNTRYFSLLEGSQEPEAKAVLGAHQDGELLLPIVNQPGDLGFERIPLSRDSYRKLLVRFSGRRLQNSKLL